MGYRNIEGKFTISFDVSSLFTNIPLEETLDLAGKLIFENNSELKITREELKELFVFFTSKTNFIFDGVIYDQIDGIAMGAGLNFINAMSTIFLLFLKMKARHSFFGLFKYQASQH